MGRSFILPWFTRNCGIGGRFYVAKRGTPTDRGKIAIHSLDVTAKNPYIHYCIFNLGFVAGASLVIWILLF